MATKIVKLPVLANGTKVALANCVEKGTVLCRIEKGLYMVLWKGHELKCRRNELFIERGGRWVTY